MSLEDLQKNLYKPEPEFENRPVSSPTLEPGRQPSPRGPETQWQETKPKVKWTQKVSRFFRSLFTFSPSQKKYFLIGSIVLLVLIIGTFIFVYYWAWQSFDKNWVTLTITGPEQTTSGEDVIYRVDYKNTNKVSLNNVQVTFVWPENSLPENGNELIKTMPLDNIAAGAEKEIEFKGKIIGMKGERKEVKATLSYQPEKMVARMENVAAFQTEISNVPLVLDFDLPAKVTSGQQVTTALRYLNDSDSPFDNLVIKIIYPDGFNVSSVLPQPQENVWQIGTLQPKQEGKILITGILSGARGDSKAFNASIGIMKDGNFVTYSDAVKSSQIALPALSIDQSINGAADYIASSGDTLNYKITYQNNSNVGIPSVKITSKFNSSALDFFSLDLKNKGSFDSTNNSITWDQTNTPELELVNPGQSGELDFSVKVKDTLPIKNFSDKNFAVYSITNIDSSNVPLALIDQQIKDSSEMTIKVNSHLTIDAKGYFQDTLLPNSGPIPPKVGQTTTYTLYWYITNSSNDVNDATIQAVLPPNVEWINRYKPTSSSFRYDALNRKIILDLGKVAAGTGVISPTKYVAFQVALTPSATQLGQVIDLLKETTIAGKDSFTNADLKITDKSVTSDLPDDESMTWEKGKVGQ